MEKSVLFGDYIWLPNRSMRQTAEREALEKITNTQIQFTLNSSPTVNGQVDLDGYVDKLSREMATTLVSKASALL